MKIICLLLVTVLFNFAHAEQKVFTFGIVPQQSAAKLARTWGPILKQMTDDTGYKIKFKTAPDIPTFEQRLSNGEYDFSYMNPYHYVVFHERNGYKAIAKAKDKKIKGILVVRKDSDVKQLSELNGHQLAFPSQAAFAASILARANLNALNVKFSPKYVSSHDSVYKSVAKGLFPAGGGVIRTFKSLDASTKDMLKILWTSQGYSPHAIAYHPRLDKKIAKQIQTSLVDLNNSVKGRQLIKKLNIKGFEKAENKDWDDVRDLQIEELSQY